MLRYEDDIVEDFDEDEPNPYTTQKISNFFGYFRRIKKTALDVKDDIISTFKPYKSSYYSLKEWEQPFLGVIQAVGGALWLLTVPLMSAFSLLNDVVDVFKTRSFTNFLANASLTLLSIVPLYLAAAALTLRGLTQVVATPLILAKKILRNFISFFSETPTIETLNSTAKLLQQGEALVHAPLHDNPKMQNIISQLHAKYREEIKRGVLSNVSVEDEERAYKAVDDVENPGVHIDRAAQHSYLNLFKKRPEPRVEQQQDMEDHHRLPHGSALGNRRY